MLSLAEELLQPLQASIQEWIQAGLDDIVNTQENELVLEVSSHHDFDDIAKFRGEGLTLLAALLQNLDIDVLLKNNHDFISKLIPYITKLDPDQGIQPALNMLQFFGSVKIETRFQSGVKDLSKNVLKHLEDERFAVFESAKLSQEVLAGISSFLQYSDEEFEVISIFPGIGTIHGHCHLKGLANYLRAYHNEGHSPPPAEQHNQKQAAAPAEVEKHAEVTTTGDDNHEGHPSKEPAPTVQAVEHTPTPTS